MPKHIFLADDDEDDRLFFEEALREVTQQVALDTAENGELLMTKLKHTVELPDLLFLDLNMPKKNGFECLEEIKKDSRLFKLPVIIFTTSQQEESINRVYDQGATYYVRKPSDYNSLKNIIKKILEMDWVKEHFQPEKAKFILTP